MIIPFFHKNIPLKPRWLLLFCWQKSKQKTMSAESASLKIGCTSLKSINLPTFHFGFKQNAFLRFVPPIFLTLTSQGGNQGIANAMDKKTNLSSRDFVFLHCPNNIHPLFPLPSFSS
ncbi:MAG: hypothetical protein IKO34_10975 [Bacteroidales bacterium]|nr:hypothetical protein [Bacteroidales bacterium]